MPLSLLNEIGEWLRSSVVSEVGKGICAEAIGEVVEAPAADVRHINAELDLVPACCIRDDVAAVEVGFGPKIVCLPLPPVKAPDTLS